MPGPLLLDAESGHVWRLPGTGTIPIRPAIGLTDQFDLIGSPSAPALLEISIEVLRVVNAKSPAEVIQRLEDARLPGSVWTDEGGKPAQMDLNVAERLEVADRRLADHSLPATPSNGRLRMSS